MKKNKKIISVSKDEALKAKAHKQIQDLISFIENNFIPVKKASDKVMIICFEKLAAFIPKQKIRANVNYTISISLADIATYMVKTKDKRLAKFDTFFKKVHAIIRKKAEAHPSYKENLVTLAVNVFTQSSKILNPKYYRIFEYVPMNYDTAHAAYQKLLDWYDPNCKAAIIACGKPCKRKKVIGENWAGFWSLITTKDGEIEGCYLSDTMDKEEFYEFLKPIDYSIYGKKKSKKVKK